MSRAAYGASIVINTQQRRLQLLNGRGTVKTCTIAVGRAGMKWYGRTQIVSKMTRPAWMPTAAIKAEIRGCRTISRPAPDNNPMGAAALVLAGGRYAIHGTNRPSSIGTFASHGCFRMHNRDVLDLYQRVSVGTPDHRHPLAPPRPAPDRSMKIPMKAVVLSSAIALVLAATPVLGAEFGVAGRHLGWSTGPDRAG